MLGWLAPSLLRVRSLWDTVSRVGRRSYHKTAGETQPSLMRSLPKDGAISSPRVIRKNPALAKWRQIVKRG
jgi:hypothetical protein